MPEVDDSPVEENEPLNARYMKTGPAFGWGLFKKL
jgi:hypothetical protein